VVTAGALNGLSSAFQALIDLGDEVIIPDPGFANYAAQVLLAGGKPIPLPHRAEDGFAPDLDELAALLTPRTRAVVLNTPANPTGAVISRPLLENVAAVLAETEIVLISDEAYERLVYAPAVHTSAAAICELRDRTISVFSMSKTYAMTGWRIGFVVATPEIATAIASVQEHVIGCPSSISQAAALAALHGPDDDTRAMKEEYSRRRQIVVDGIAATPGLLCRPPEGAFYAFPSVPGAQARDIAGQLAEEARVLVVPGTAFGNESRSSFRISYAGDTETVVEGMRRIADTFRGGA